MPAQIDHTRIITHVADTISAGAILGTFVGLLPPIAAFAATVWYFIQVYESHTVQKWVRLHTRHRRAYRSLHRHNRLVHRTVRQKAVHQVEPPSL